MTITYPEMIDVEYYIVLYLVKHIFSPSKRKLLFFLFLLFLFLVMLLRRM